MLGVVAPWKNKMGNMTQSLNENHEGKRPLVRIIRGQDIINTDCKHTL
jgi:hypothetical protein